MKYKIVADTTANLFTLQDIPFAYAPLKIITSEKEYIDTPDLDVSGMVDDLLKVKGKTGTSCPNVHEWLEAFGDAENVFAVTITSNLSGSYAAAVQAKEDYLSAHPDRNVCIVDSLSAGPEMAMLVEKLREDILAGLTFEEIEKNIFEYHKTTHLSFSLQSLVNLARNGRVSPAVAKVAGVLGIRVVGKASDVGTLEPLHKCRGEKRALETIFSDMKSMGFSGGKVRISHCFNPESAQQLKDMILAEYPDTNLEIVSCTALCSYYAEKGGLLVGFEG